MMTGAGRTLLVAEVALMAMAAAQATERITLLLLGWLLSKQLWRSMWSHFRKSIRHGRRQSLATSAAGRVEILPAQVEAASRSTEAMHPGSYPQARLQPVQEQARYIRAGGGYTI